MEKRIGQGRELFELGRRLGGLGTVVIGSAGGELAKALARSAGCGAALMGAEVKFHDGRCAACGAWLSQYYDLPSALFVRQDGGRIGLDIRDGQGRPFEPPEPMGVRAPHTGQWDLLAAADSAWAAVRAGGTRRSGIAAVEGPDALALALERMGYTVVQRPERGMPVFRGDREGFCLTVELDGVTFHPQGADALAAAAAFEMTPQAIPAFRPETELF